MWHMIFKWRWEKGGKSAAMIEHETKEYWKEKAGISFGMSKERSVGEIQGPERNQKNVPEM